MSEELEPVVRSLGSAVELLAVALFEAVAVDAETTIGTVVDAAHRVAAVALDLQERARAMVDHARTEADSLTKQARDNAVTIVDQARADIDALMRTATRQVNGIQPALGTDRTANLFGATQFTFKDERRPPHPAAAAEG